MNDNDIKRREAGKINGKLGGRPSGLVLVVDGEGRQTGVIRRGGLPCGWADPVGRYQGGGWWLFTHPDGWRWVVKAGEGKIPPGRYVGRYVPKGKTPLEAIHAAGGAKGKPGAGLPDFRRVETPLGAAYIPAEHWRADPTEMGLVVNRHWAGQGKAEWERAGWSMEEEKRRMGAAEIAAIVTLELGETWGEIAKAWVRRGRVLPHIWGEARKVWIRERLRQKALEGFEV